MSYQHSSVHVNALGPKGTYISDTSLHTLTPPARYIQAHVDTVISSATSVGNTCPSGTLTTVELPAGQIWGGRFSAITLAAGAVTAYEE